MELNIKDGIFIIVYIVTVVSLWNGFHNDILNSKKDISLFKKVIFSKSGDIILTTKRDCERVQESIQKRCDEDRVFLRTVSDKIIKMDQNIIMIMTHLNINEANVLFQSKHKGEKND